MDSANSMAKPILEKCGLQLVPFERDHVMPFFSDMSLESKRELRVAYGIEPLDALFMALEHKMVYAVIRNGHPLAVTGLDKGFMWALFGNGLRRNWYRFVKASPALISYYHGFEPELVCDIWARNGMIAQWLAHLGFEPVAQLDLDSGHEFVRFVRCHYETPRVLNFPSRPVIH
jgi:hypothetical protein